MTFRKYSDFLIRCALASITSSSSDCSGIIVFASAVHFPNGHAAANANSVRSGSLMRISMLLVAGRLEAPQPDPHCRNAQ
jgi:hypothetical protein